MSGANKFNFNNFIGKAIDFYRNPLGNYSAAPQQAPIIIFANPTGDCGCSNNMFNFNNGLDQAFMPLPDFSAGINNTFTPPGYTPVPWFTQDLMPLDFSPIYGQQNTNLNISAQIQMLDAIIQMLQNESSTAQETFDKNTVEGYAQYAASKLDNLANHGNDDATLKFLKQTLPAEKTDAQKETYQKALSAFSQKAFNFDKADIDGDGKVTNDEFIQAQGGSDYAKNFTNAVDFAYNEQGKAQRGNGDGIIDERDLSGYYKFIDEMDGAVDGKITRANDRSVFKIATSGDEATTKGLKNNIRASFNFAEQNLKPETEQPEGQESSVTSETQTVPTASTAVDSSATTTTDKISQRDKLVVKNNEIEQKFQQAASGPYLFDMKPTANFPYGEYDLKKTLYHYEGDFPTRNISNPNRIFDEGYKYETRSFIDVNKFNGQDVKQLTPQEILASEIIRDLDKNGFITNKEEEIYNNLSNKVKAGDEQALVELKTKVKDAMQTAENIKNGTNKTVYKRPSIEEITPEQAEYLDISKEEVLKLKAEYQKNNQQIQQFKKEL